MLLFCILFAVTLHSSHASPWDWGQVAIGGGGYVDGIIAHPTEPDLLYIRCDVGGVYRFDFVGLSWVPLLDAFGPEQKNLYGGDSIAIDPNNPDILYVAVGMYNYWGNGDVIKSTDRGLTWEFTNLNLQMGANQEVRYAGERLMVNPKNSEQLYYGSRYDGLWVKNGNSSWQIVSSLSANGTAGYGVVFIVFDGSTMYAGVYDEGIYVSGDGGTTRKLLQGSPTEMIRAVVPSPGSLVVTAVSGVWKFNGSWTNISPVQGLPYGPITVHPVNHDFIIAGVRLGAVMLGVYRTWDGGKTWENLTPNVTVIHDVPWWSANMFAGATGQILIDPLTPSRAYLTDWFGVYFCYNIESNQTTWYTQEKGHEEVFGIALHAPSNGGVYAGTADMDGFKITDYTNYPLSTFGGTSDFHLQDTDSIDSAVFLPNILVRVGTSNSPPLTGNGGFSLDGTTWKQFPTLPVTDNYAIGGVIAISPDSSTIVWWPFQSIPYFSTDFGTSWTPSSGGAFNNNSCCHDSLGIDAAYSLTLASDKVNSSVFYTFDELSGNFLATVDGARTWVNMSSTLAKSFSPSFTNANVKAVPNKEGEVWVSLGNGGLWRSSDYGKSFTQIGNVTQALLFAFGKAAPASNEASVYVLGVIGGVSGVFTSSDFGITWEYISDPAIGLGDSPWSMAADMETYGRVFIGTLGRGIYVANVL